MAFLGIDLGGTKLAAAVFAAGGELLHRESTPLADRRGGAIGALIVERIRKLSEKHAVDGVGVCVPGLYRASRGTVWAPNIPQWDDYPLRDELRSALGGQASLTIR